LFKTVVSARDGLWRSGSGMPAGGGDFGLCVLDRAGSSTERNPESLEAFLELETSKLEQLGRLPEIDPLIEVVADHPRFEKILWTVGVSAGGAKGEGSQKPVVERIQEDDPLLPSACHDGELSLSHPV